MRIRDACASALAATLLAACAPATVQTYEGPAKARNEVAVLRGVADESPGTGVRYYVFFVSYASYVPGVKPFFNKVGDSFSGYPKELTMLPGDYIVMTRCATGNQYAFPAIRLRVAAGDDFEVKCEPVPNALSRVRVVARRAGDAPEWREPVSRDKLDDLLPLMK